MQCPACRHENPPQAKFCLECGTRMALACLKCRAELPQSAKFCLECGERVAGASIADPHAPAPSHFASPDSYTPKHLAERILTSKTALEGERKQVTVLFADLKGSMELLADRDPEEARKILDPVLELMMDAVHRFEGMVNQVMGDGIMALFGAPIAHEDHAVRACYAALRMQESAKRYADGVWRTHGVRVQIRVGLNSGGVVVRAIGSDLHMDYTAVGQTTHLAARMEQLAEPGTVFLTPATLHLAEGFVEVKSLGPTPVKGLADPIETYALTGATAARSRLHAAAARGLTKFVGRAAEMQQLHEALDRAKSGRGQIVAVVGEPGVGKSRLYREFTRSHRTDDCLVVEAASVSYSKATAYYPVIELLKAYFAIEPRDDTRKIRERVTGKLLSLDRALEPSLPALLALLDVPTGDEQWDRLEPPQRRRRTLDGVRGLLLRESQIQPLVVVFEDLHWIDSETQALLDTLIETLPTARVLLLVNYRPEYSHGWGSKTYYRQLRVDPLPPATAQELLDAMLGSDASTIQLKRLLIERTDGNPFFVEESVRTRVESGVLRGERGAYTLAGAVESIEIPSTAQAILAARIDRLYPEDKRLLQAAAVIGKDFPLRLLPEIADVSEESLARGLARLQSAEFVYETRLFPDAEYTFKHALTQDVAYAGMLRERQRELHARIVAAIETLYHDRLPEHVERLAHHAVRGDVREKAVRYLRQAAAKATKRSALRDASVWLEQARGVIAGLPQDRATLEDAFDVCLELRAVSNMLGEIRRSRELLRDAEGLAEQLEDDRRRGRACTMATIVYALLGELDEAVVSGVRARDIADTLGDFALRIAATSYLIQTHYLRCELERAVELALENIAAVPAERAQEQFGNVSPPAVYDRGHLILCLGELGRFREIEGHQANAIRLAEATNQPFTIGFTYRCVALAHLMQGDLENAHRCLERSVAILRLGNVVLPLPAAVALSAWVLALIGDEPNAILRLDEGIALADAHGGDLVGNYGQVYHSLGRASLLLDRVDAAHALAQRSVELSRQHPGFAAWAQHLLGDIHRMHRACDVTATEAQYRKALTVAEARGMRPLVAHCHASLARLYQTTGKLQQAQEHFATAATMYREMGMTYWLDRAT